MVFTVVACVLWGCDITRKGSDGRNMKDVNVDGDAVGLGDNDLQIGLGAIVRPRKWDVDIKARREMSGVWLSGRGE